MNLHHRGEENNPSSSPCGGLDSDSEEDRETHTPHLAPGSQYRTEADEATQTNTPPKLNSLPERHAEANPATTPQPFPLLCRLTPELEEEVNRIFPQHKDDDFCSSYEFDMEIWTQPIEIPEELKDFFESCECEGAEEGVGE